MSGRILIVDKIATHRIMLRAALQGAHYDVEACSSLPEVEEILAGPATDVVLIDMSHDETTGLGLCKALKARADRGGPQIIALGSGRNGAARIAALRAGADDVLDRDDGISLLLARIRNVMRTRNAARELVPAGADDQGQGFAEAGEGFTGAGRVAVLTRRPDALPAVLTKVLDRHAGATSVLSSRDDLPGPAAGQTADLFIVDAADVTKGGAQASDLLRIIADLRSSGATHHASTLVMLPERERDLAALTLDLGANDQVTDDICADELAFRVRGLIRRKLRNDRQRDQLQFQLQEANFDPLTGLSNRRHAFRRLERMAEVSRSSGQSFAIMVLDIDHFKSINDTHGHATGDRVLAEVARRLRDNLRAVDLVARIGGEEFLVAMPDTPAENAHGAAERLRRIIEGEPFGLSAGPRNAEIRVTLSIGVVIGPSGTLPDQAGDTMITTLFERADRALYAAKTMGRNMVTVDHCAA
jgi:two-component system cell cycle response regulator